MGGLCQIAGRREKDGVGGGFPRGEVGDEIQQQAAQPLGRDPAISLGHLTVAFPGLAVADFREFLRGRGSGQCGLGERPHLALRRLAECGRA